MLLGWVNIYAAVYDEEHQSIFTLSQNYGKQLIWIVTSLVLAIVVLMIDGKFFAAFSFPAYGLMILLLIAVLVLGREVGGSKSWFAIGSIRFQPSEFAKFATCLAIAKYLSFLNIKIRNIKTKIITALLICVPASLILLQHDAGSALVYISLVLVLYREGLSGNFLLLGLFAIILFIITLVLQNTFVDLPFDITVSGKTILISILILIAASVYLLIGHIFGMKKGVLSEPFKGKSGVYVVVVDEIVEVTSIEDYSSNQSQLINNMQLRVDYEVFNALQDKANVVDNRHIFY